MSFFQIISLVVGLVKFLPQIVSLVSSILELLKSLKGAPGFNEKATLAELRDAIHEVKQNKDTSKLEALHRKLNTWCVGDECPIVGVPV